MSHPQLLFIYNVAAHWVASMSSVVSFTLGIIETIRNRKTEGRIFFSVAGLFLILAFDQAWQDEHRNSELLKAEKAVASSEKNFWESQSYQKDNSLRVRDELLTQNYEVLAQTQSSLAELSNKLVDIAKPAPFKADVMRWKIPAVLHTPSGPTEITVLVLIGNRTMDETRGTFSCDKPFTGLTSTILTHGSAMRADWEQKTPTSVHVEYSYPPWSKSNPLVFSVATPQGKDVENCSFKLD
jgi:hypothetical protein